MKINTITCHDVYNSGASLQAYALQTYLESLGHEVAIIDYKPDYLSGYFNFFKVSNPKFGKNIFFKSTYLIAKSPQKLFSLKKKKAFDLFRKQYLKLTSKQYHSNEDLKIAPPIADAYIAGSDQIWNTFFPNGKDAAFYLDFAPKSTLRLSYAASFATSSIESNWVPFISKNLKQFNVISVREKSGLKILSEMDLEGELVCDPVLLMDSHFWEKLTRPMHINEPYLLIYDFEKNDFIKKIAQQYAKQFDLKIVSVNLPLDYADLSFPYAGPIEFLSLINQASCIMSNSFHATVFSLIFNKKFYVYPRIEQINSRMTDLLDYLNLPTRMLLPASIQAFEDSIDYAQVTQKLSLLIESSKNYLHKALSSYHA